MEITNPILANKIAVYKEFVRLAGQKYKFDHQYFLTDLYDRDVILPRQYWQAPQIKSQWQDYINNIDDQRRANISMYMAVPHCHSKCTYCMYNIFITKDPVKLEEYTQALIKSLEYYAETFNDIELLNFYCGGGTPSLLNANQWQRIWESLFSLYKFKPNAEKTWEANPDTTTRDQLEVMKAYGINRVSFGIQSFDYEVLKNVNRDYQTTEHIKNTAQWARELDLVSDYDLMAGLPGETSESFLHGLDTLLALKPNTVSVYPFVPTRVSLRKFYAGKVDQYEQEYQDLISRIEETKTIAAKHGYDVQGFESFIYRRGMSRAVVFARKDRAHLPDRYFYNMDGNGSILGIGYYANSFIGNKLRYRSQPLQFDPGLNNYEGVAIQPIDEVYYYLLGCLAEENCVDKQEFKIKFGYDLEKFLAAQKNDLDQIEAFTFTDTELVLDKVSPYDRFLLSLFLLPSHYIMTSFTKVYPNLAQTQASFDGGVINISLSYNINGPNRYKIKISPVKITNQAKYKIIFLKLNVVFKALLQEEINDIDDFCQQFWNRAKSMVQPEFEPIND